MDEYIPDNYDHDCEMLSASDNDSPPESLAEPGLPDLQPEYLAEPGSSDLQPESMAEPGLPDLQPESMAEPGSSDHQPESMAEPGSSDLQPESMAEPTDDDDDDDDFARPAATFWQLLNSQLEPVAEPGPRRQPTKLTDDYKLLGQLGKGAYGVVKKAQHRQSGKIIAVKRIKMEPGEDFSTVRREISLMEKVSHSNIVAYYGSYLNNNLFSICMEFCAGGSLQKNFRAKGPLSELQIAYVCREALTGLQYLHSRRPKIIHRDIKGANILLTDDGNVKLADFGVSAELTKTTSKRGTDVGTTHWMAPEMFKDGENVEYDEKCDIWALGITSIELAECRPPNSNISSSRLAVKMSKRDFKEPSLMEMGRWTVRFHAFVDAALTIETETRPSAEELLTHGFVTQRLPECIGKGILRRNNVRKKR